MKHIPVTTAKKYRSALHFCNEINNNKIKLPVRVQVGMDCFTITPENITAVWFGCLMASAWWEDS